MKKIRLSRAVRKSLLAILAILALLQLPKAKPPTTLKDLNFDAHSWHGYTVYIEENKKYQPYYVLTDNYNGQRGATLLLRKYILEDFHEYDLYFSEQFDHAFYKKSSLDQYLNSDFLRSLSLTERKAILDSSITIASQASLGSTEHYVEEITRKVFLLSITELGFDDGHLMETEGIRLNCFRWHMKKLLVASSKDGSNQNWWTRSASKWGATTAWVISYNGWSSDAPTGALLGVRPAFCLPGDLPVELRAGTNNGAQGYVIARE